eukprot:1153682-Pelagomonas_calceolata.AAC.4
MRIGRVVGHAQRHPGSPSPYIHLRAPSAPRPPLKPPLVSRDQPAKRQQLEAAQQQHAGKSKKSLCWATARVHQENFKQSALTLTAYRGVDRVWIVNSSGNSDENSMYCDPVRKEKLRRRGHSGCEHFNDHLTAMRARSREHLRIRRLPGRHRLLNHAESSIP